MEIRNEVKTSGKEVEKKKFVVRNAADIQRAKLDKLMKNPDKPVVIPAPARNRDFSNAIPSFVRNVMGSSAGAGSGEFHVYRHLRRKEYARQKQIQEKSRAEQLDDDFQDKLEQNRQTAEDRTSKKRAKRLKKKAKQKAQRGKKPKLAENDEQSSSSESDDAANDEQIEGEIESVLNPCQDGVATKDKTDERDDENAETATIPVSEIDGEDTLRNEASAASKPESTNDPNRNKQESNES